MIGFTDKMTKAMKLKMTGYYPCHWDDLINEKGKVYATIHTLKCVKKDRILKLKEGITFDNDDKVYEIVVNIPELTEKIVLDSLRNLSKITGLTYQLGKARKRYVSV